MLEIAYATDEDIALRASADFAILCPRDQRVASGSDGYFEPTDRWTLRSIASDFANQGVRPGHVVQLLGPSVNFRPPGELLVVVSASAHAVTLRRKGQDVGLGQPPSPLSGLIGVEFLIATLSPQISDASLEMSVRLGVLPSGSGRPPSDQVAARDLRDAVVLSVLHRQYLDMSREAGGSNPDTLSAKAEAAKVELDERLARSAVRSSSVDGVTMPRFAARISR